jgi:flagellar assembly factor FliW
MFQNAKRFSASLVNFQDAADWSFLPDAQFPSGARMKNPAVQAKTAVFRAGMLVATGRPWMNTVELDLDKPPALESETVIHLPSGLLGFERCKKYLLFSNPHEEPFHWLQVIGDPSLTFLVVSPFEVLPGYQPDIPTEDARGLQLEAPEDAFLLNIITLRRGGVSTVNLKGPIVVNRFSLIGKQVVIANAAEYSVQHPLPGEEH